MMVMSPGHSRVARFLVLRSRRAVAVTPGRSSDASRRFLDVLRGRAIIAESVCQIRRLLPSAPGPLGRSGREQLLRVCPAELGVLQASQHPGPLPDPARLVEPGDPAPGYRAVGG